jgi:hypothetical protein
MREMNKFGARVGPLFGAGFDLSNLGVSVLAAGVFGFPSQGFRVVSGGERRTRRQVRVLNKFIPSISTSYSSPTRTDGCQRPECKWLRRKQARARLVGAWWRCVNTVDEPGGGRL